MGEKRTLLAEMIENQAPEAAGKQEDEPLSSPKTAPKPGGEPTSVGALLVAWVKLEWCQSGFATGVAASIFDSKSVSIYRQGVLENIRIEVLAKRLIAA